MADSNVTLNLGTDGSKVDTETLTSGSDTVHRQRIQVGGNALAEIADVSNSTPTGSEYGLVTRAIIAGRPTLYACSTTSSVSVSGSASTTLSAAYLWHPSSVSLRYEIIQIVVSLAGGTGGQGWRMVGSFISAENGAPGGSSGTIRALNRGSAASGGTFRIGATGAPSRVSGDMLLAGGVTAQNDFNQVLFDANSMGGPIVLRASEAEGFELRTVTGSAPTTAPYCYVHMIWAEV